MNKSFFNSLSIIFNKLFYIISLFFILSILDRIPIIKEKVFLTSLGIYPYILSSVIINIFYFITGKIEDIKLEGSAGINKMKQITKATSIIFAILFSLGYFSSIHIKYITISNVLLLTTGTSILIWIAEKFSELGIGNGSSYIVFYSILNREVLFGKAIFNIEYSFISLLIILFIENISLKLKILFTNTILHQIQNKSLNKIFIDNSLLTFKITSASLSTLLISYLIQGFLQSINIINLNIYIKALIIALSALGSNFMVFNPFDIAKRIEQNGCFIPGVRPGSDTESYLTKLVIGLSIFTIIYSVLIISIESELITRNIPLLLDLRTMIILASIINDFKSYIYFYMPSDSTIYK